MNKNQMKKPPKKTAKAQPVVSVRIKTHNDNKGGHPHIIMDNIDDKHVSVGITHDKYKGKNHPNYALSRNPFGGKEQSYMRRQGTVAPKKEYSGSRTGKMTKKDFAQAKVYAERAKQKYRDGKKNKKK